MVSQTAENIYYNSMEATIMAIMKNESNNQYTVKRSSLMETFILKQGINKFGQKIFRANGQQVWT